MPFPDDPLPLAALSRTDRSDSHCTRLKTYIGPRPSISETTATRSKLEHPFKVIVVGGSIAGLTLAHCFERAGIDYIVLERRDEFAPQVGASVGIMPNGARILDQLGFFDAVEAEIEPLDKSHIGFPDEFSFSSTHPTLLHQRHVQFGYPVSFLDRQKLLAILYNGLKDNGKLQLRKEVVRVEQVDTAMRVLTRDGSCYEADLVVGADGVHSGVRSEMWRAAEAQQPGLITQTEKTAMYAEYSCIYGISSAVPELIKGEQVTRFYDGLTILTFHGKEGRVFWFVIQKLDKKYYYPNCPRFDKLDAEAACDKLESCKLWDGATFGDLWARREVYSMTALEENVFQHWHFGRIVCLGDSMLKMTVALGQGANSAIECAAHLANTLHDLIHIHGIDKPSNSDIEARLSAFTKERRERATGIFKIAGFITRLHARDGLFNKFIGRYVAPYAGDRPAKTASNIMVGASKLEYIPVPARSGKDWKAGDQPVGQMPKALSALGVIALSALAVKVLHSCWGRFVL